MAVILIFFGGATVCAVQTAIFKAVSEGEKSFSAICIVGGKNGDVQDFCSPCGILPTGSF